MAKADELLLHWREAGPVTWAEGPGGWIGEDGLPIVLAPWQRAVLGAWWANRAQVSTLGISNTKKTGKTLLDAVLLAWRWLALPGLHFAAANSLDQAAARQFEMIADMVARHPYLRTVVDVQRTRLVFNPTGSRLEALPADPTSIAGANFLTASHTEAWGVIHEGDRQCWEELTPPPGRFYGLPALRVADSYAGLLGQSTTWHSLVDRGLEGKRIDQDWPVYLAEGLLLFHATGEWAREHCFRGTPADREAYYDEQARTLRPATWERFHNNQRTAGEGAFVSREAWEACRDPDLTATGKMYLAVDASTSKDTTAAVGVIVEAGVPLAVYVRTWEPKRGVLRRGKPTVDLTAVDKTVRALFKDGRVARVCYDPFQLHSIALGWERDNLPVFEFPQGTMRLEADGALLDLVRDSRLRHNGDKTLTEHVLNAATSESVRGIRIVKQPGSRPIDACVALSMACHLALEVTQKGTPTSEVNRIYDDGPDELPAKSHPATLASVRACRRGKRGLCQTCSDFWEIQDAPMLEHDREMAPWRREVERPESEGPGARNARIFAALDAATEQADVEGAAYRSFHQRAEKLAKELGNG